MDLLEVDPKLFITCRLCIEDVGVYQIVPALQYQIKYCFDITVDSFDGLPQLLCKKCHTLLSDYAVVKKTYIEKQGALKAKLLVKKEEPFQEIVPVANGDVNTSEHSEANVSAESEKKTKVKPKRRKRMLSPSSTDTNSVTSDKHNKKISAWKSSTKKSTKWKSNYTKYFVCKICSLMYRHKKSVKVHYYVHSFLRANHHSIFDSQCSVRLPKIDNKPNITGQDNTVVFSKNRIIQDDNSDAYHILYVPKAHHSSDSSDCELIPTKQSKIRRLDSLSSNDTVCIGNSNKNLEEFDKEKPTDHVKPITEGNQMNELEAEPIFIDLDDSSSDANIARKEEQQDSSITTKVDMKTVENIVTVCRNKYDYRYKKNRLTVNDFSRTQLDTQLKHKLLSFGRKTINMNGFITTRLLRYLEHKNLNVFWEPVSPKKAQSTRELSYVRIAAIMTGQDHQRVLDDSGWVDMVGQCCRDKTSSKTLNEGTSNKGVLNIIPTGSSILITSSESNAVDKIVLTDIRSVEDTNSKKLLNVNPVANPKQYMPKKSYTQHNNDPVKSVVAPQKPFEPVMPVITSTKSLAGETNKKESEPTSATNTSVDKPVARIKVKPVSELMEPKVSTSTTTTNQALPWNCNQIQNGTEEQVNLFVPNMLVSQIQSQATQLPSRSAPLAEPAKTDYIVLDTVDMPNTRTDSPFAYFRNLLQLHGLVLIEANSELTKDFTCLLKFKVQFKQENKSNPVTLCLSLHCSENKFCMCIKDANHINIHIAKMSANWQWEIIKVYQGDVSTKILNNAQKAGFTTHTNTNTFLCLLKSIIHKQDQGN